MPKDIITFKNPIVLPFHNENDNRHIDYVIDFDSQNVSIRETIDNETFTTNCEFVEIVHLFEVISHHLSPLI